MKVNFNTFNFISPTKTFFKQNTCVPTTKFRAINDEFVRTCKVDEKVESKPALPKYLYHLTNSKCYNAIMRSGEIRPSKDTIDGVYMFDMKDFQKNWRTNPNHHKSRVLAEDLIAQAIKKEEGLVLMRIPTEKLNPNNFVIRPQDELNAYLNGDEYKELKRKYKTFGEVLKHRQEFPDYIKNGYPLSDAIIFYDTARAVEYIHKGPVDIDKNKVKKIFELPDVSKDTFKDYDLADYNALFDSLDLASKSLNLVA